MNRAIKNMIKQKALLFCCLFLAAVQARAVSSVNLIINGDAEVANCTSDWKAVTTVPGWRVTKGNPSVVCYTSAVFLTPNAASNGKAFLADGPNGDSTMFQSVDLSSASTAIDAGLVKFNLSGWLGGYGAFTGEASVSANFYDGHGQLLQGGGQLSGDTPTARGSANLFYATNVVGPVPIGARTALVTVQFFNTAGIHNVGYAETCL